MKKTVIKRRKRVPAATSKSGGNSSGTSGKTAHAEDLSGAPYHPSLHAHDEPRMQMSDRAAAEALVAVGRVRRHADTNDRDYSTTPHRIPSPEGWNDGEPKRKRQKKGIDGPEHDNDHGHHPRLVENGRSARRNGAANNSGRDVEKGRADAPPPPPSERLETTTLTLSNSTVGRGLSRSGTPADGSTRDNGFNRSSRAQSVQEPLTTTTPPTLLQHSHSAPTYTHTAHHPHHSRSGLHTPAKEASPPSASDSRTSESSLGRDGTNGHHSNSRNGMHHLSEPNVKVEGWQRPRNGNGVDLPPLSSLHADIGRDEESRRVARRPSWTPHLSEELVVPPRNGASSPSLVNGRTHESARTSPSSREDLTGHVNGHIVHRQESKPHIAAPVNNHGHPRISPNPSSRLNQSTSPELGHPHHPHRTQTHSPRNQPMQAPTSRPSSRSSHLLSSSELETHYRELQSQKVIWEEMMDKTQRYMDTLWRAIEETRERERDLTVNGHGPASVPLPGRSSSSKDRVWSWTNGTEKEH